MDHAGDLTTERAGDPPIDTEVLVVGAGPTGLLLAAELRRRGVTAELVDAAAGPMHWDRATVIHPGSLEVFDALGLIDDFLAAGLRQRAVRIHSDGRRLGEIDLADSGSSFGFNLGLSEEVTESLLTRHLRSHGGDVRRNERLVDLDQHDEFVTASIETPDGTATVRARWLVGCDGFHGAVRDLVGVGFVGGDIEQPWAVFDATCDGWAGEFDVTYSYLDDPPVILTPLPGRRWRIYLRPSSATADLTSEAAATVGRYEPAVRLIDVENPTVFHCHNKVASRYRSGRILLAGDAAHVCSPAEGHGMNSGVQDAVNLAWKLALVCRGEADGALLDSYEAERRPVALMITESGAAVEIAQAATSPVDRRARNRAIAEAFAEPTARHHEVVAEAEMNIDVAASPIVAGDAEALPRPGDRLPDVAVVDGDVGRTRLRHLAVRTGHSALVISRSDADETDATALAAELDRVVSRSPVFGTTASDRRTAIARVDADGAARLGMTGTTVFAVRPDGFIGLRAAAREALDALDAYDARVRAGGQPRDAPAG